METNVRKVVSYKDSANRWRWTGLARNGRVVADSGGSYASPGAAETAGEAAFPGVFQERLADDEPRRWQG